MIFDNLEYYLFSFSIIPLVAGRGAMTLFSSALVARFGMEWQFLAEETGTQLLANLPNWILADTFLLILGVFAIAEHILQRTPELQHLLDLGETKLKGIFAFFLCFFLVQGNIQDLETHFNEVGPTTDFAGFLSIEYFWAFAIGCVTWFIATIRRSVYLGLAEMDPEDDLKLRSLLLWLETGLGLLGPFIVIMVPGAAIIAALIAMAALYLVDNRIKAKEASQRIQCSNCDYSMHHTAPYCAQCNTVNRDVRNLTWLGQADDSLVTDAKQHQFLLKSHKRCSHCGERSSEQSVNITCEHCGHSFFDSIADADAYLAGIRAKLPKVLVVTALFSLIPIIGIIPGMIYYRLELTRGLRAYLPRINTFATRWAVRIICLILLFWQVIPALGIVALPLMALINFLVYSQALRNQFNKQLGQSSAFPAIPNQT